MIIYGHNSTLIGTVSEQHQECPNCQHTGDISIHVFSKYGHIFWIPFFPYKRFTVVHCSNCDKSWEDSAQFGNIRREAENTKQLFKPPIWHFSGLILVAVIIIWASVSSKLNKANEAEYIKSPNIGDVYSFKVEEGGYSLAKVFYAQDSLIGVLSNEYAATQKSGVDELYLKKFTDTGYLSLDELIEMYNDGTIYKIKRNKGVTN